MDKTPNVMSGKGLPEISDSGDLILVHALLPYRHSISWMTRQTYEPGQGSLCATSGASTVQSLRASGRCVSGQQGDPPLLGLESVSVSDVRPTDPAFGSARSGGVSECAAFAPVPHRFARASHPFDAGRRQRTARLSAVRGPGPTADRFGSDIVRERRLGAGTQWTGLCAGFDDHRSVSVALSLGGFPSDQGGYQGACAARSACSDSGVRQPDVRQGARCKDSGSTDAAHGFVVGRRPGLSGLQTPVPVERPGSRLCLAQQDQYAGICLRASPDTGSARCGG